MIGHLVTRLGLSTGDHAPFPTLIEPASPTLEFSKKIVVSMVDFEQTSLGEAVDYLRSMSRTGVEMPGEPPPFRLNFIVDDPMHAARPIDLRMKSVRLDQLCGRIAQAAGVRVTFEPDAIVFSAETQRDRQNEVNDLSKLDPQTRADATLQMWYAAQAQAASILGSETGHEFRPIWMGRSPITVLEEQSDVMQRWITDRKWGYPPETARDPADGARIDWEDHLPPDDPSATSEIWFGKHARTGEWMAYEQGKGVYKPPESLMKRIHGHEKTQR